MKLFVAKLNRETTEADLTANFNQFGGVVSVKVVSDRDSGQSKCFGFIEMDSAEAGEAAIAGQNGQEFMGFRMVVKEAEEKPRSTRPSSYGGHGGGRSDENSSRENSSNNSNVSADNKSNQNRPSNFPSSTNKKRTHSKKSKGGPDKYADGPKTTTHSKRPKSNRNQWLDDLDDY